MIDWRNSAIEIEVNFRFCVDGGEHWKFFKGEFHLNDKTSRSWMPRVLWTRGIVRIFGFGVGFGLWLAKKPKT